MAKRKRVDADTQTRVLSRSIRRCCLCFYLKQDFSEKIGQIAHVDKNPQNDAEDNLVWLCLEHHSLFDSRTSQHKNYTPEEVSHAREKLHQRILAINVFGAEHDRLNAEWKQIAGQMEHLQGAIQGYITDQNLKKIEDSQRQLDALWNRISQIVDRQFSIEQDFFRF